MAEGGRKDVTVNHKLLRRTRAASQDRARCSQTQAETKWTSELQDAPIPSRRCPRASVGLTQGEPLRPHAGPAGPATTHLLQLVPQAVLCDAQGPHAPRSTCGLQLLDVEAVHTLLSNQLENKVSSLFP